MRLALSIVCFAVTALFSLVATRAQADIYTCRHPDGSTELTDSPCPRHATTVSVMRSLRPPTASNVGTAPALSTNKVQNNGNGAYSTGGSSKWALAARVEPNVQKNRDDIRRRVLSDELLAEEKSLSDAKQQFNGGNVAPAPNESQNSPAYLDRRARLQQAVALHEKNVSAIRQELSNLR